MAKKTARHAAILEITGAHVVASQEELRHRLARRGVVVTQATLSRDLRELGPILKLTLVEEAGGKGARRVYRAEEKDMVEFYTVNYTGDARIDDLQLFSEY